MSACPTCGDRRVRQHAMRISVWGQLATAPDVHLGVQMLEFLVRDELRVARRPNAFCLNASSSPAGALIEHENVCQNPGTLLLDANKALGHETLLAVAKAYLGSGLIDQSQKRTAAAMQIADK